MTNSIALLVDSGMDVPKEVLQKEGVYEIPLNIIYKDAVYTDKKDITDTEIYARLDEEIPSTSLPSGQSISDILEKIIADGYTKLVVATISSGLSGTHNALKLMLEDFPELTTVMIDTKCIAIGGGLQGVYAKELIDSGLDLTSIRTRLNDMVKNARVYFSISTLEYLKKGGRIGLVSSVIGSALNLHPVISCNEDGVYHTIAKARGRKRSLEKMIQDAEAFVKDHSSYDIGVAYTACIEDATKLAETLKQRLPNYNHFYFHPVSPALGIHAGPDGLGFGILAR
ncbi:DegV family protein [Vagococcus intermedius]|uniref:DegV family protein n=1 Tax=Vagococcus intermedius TaxID=2991418 RepID=A0AAF0CV64_9ENTE|nr:DegV family protein [Vagococcus intermedius]WEG73461.1 DegV family protein [Vagococcus intermedius]WEG75544.1 DegV family protein [Vagococcus intermedius]